MFFNIARFNALVALLAALSLPLASAHPLDKDVSSGILERASNVSARADNDGLPGYQETPTEELPGYSEEPPEGAPPEYVVESGPGRQRLKSLKLDEENMTVTINNGKVYRIAPNPAELGVADKNGLSRKYYIIDDNPEAGDEPIKMAVLKIVDLLKAKRFDKSVPKILQEEGYYWGKFKYYMWDKTVKQIEGQGKHRRLTKWEYRVVYVPLRNGLDLGEIEETEDGGQESMMTEMKYVHEWAIEQRWTTENVKAKLARCKATAISAHEGFAARGFGITNTSPKVWVTDENCRFWLPNQIDPSYEYVNHNTKAAIIVRGAKRLKDSKAREKYLKEVKARLKEVFTVSSLQEQGYTFVTMENDIAQGNVDQYT